MASPFLKLPAELRILVYEFYSMSDIIHFNHPAPISALLEVCRQIRKEYLPVLESAVARPWSLQNPRIRASVKDLDFDNLLSSLEQLPPLRSRNFQLTVSLTSPTAINKNFPSLSRAAQTCFQGTIFTDMFSMIVGENEFDLVISRVSFDRGRLSYGQLKKFADHLLSEGREGNCLPALLTWKLRTVSQEVRGRRLPEAGSSDLLW